MSYLIKKPYEISVWEDVLTFVDNQGNLITSIPEDYSQPLITQFYDERKICVIGSDTMNTPIRAVEPQLTSGINGTCTLTFSLYYKYYDEETGERYDNPFVRYLVNERKIKLRHGAHNDPNCKWYDMVIKSITEDSENKKFVYTAKSLFVNELSKSGFDLEFNPKLENSTGTITFLAKEILKESDWKVGDDCSTLLQYMEEPVYKIKVNSDIYGKDMLTGQTIGPIKSGSYIYVFYSHIANKEQNIQFLYHPSDNYEINEDRVIINAPSSSLSDKGSNYLLTSSFSYSEDTYENKPTFAATMELVSEYRGARLVRKPKQTYDKVLDRYVYTYKKNGEEYYGYEETKYNPPMAVSNYITSPRDFIEDDAGWRPGGFKNGEETVFPELAPKAYPDIYGPYAYLSEPTLCFKFSNTEQKIYNSGIADNRSVIESLVEGEEYVFRIEIKQANGNTLAPISPTNLFSIQIGTFDLEDGVYSILEDGKLFDFATSSWTISTQTEDKYDAEGNSSQVTRTFYYKRAKCKKSMSYSEMITSNLGVFIIPQSDCLGKTYYLTEAQLFPYLEAKKGEEVQMCIPGELYEPYVETIYYYYPKNNSFNSPEDYSYSTKSSASDQSYELVYNDQQDTENSVESGYEKVRSITASESNRFNLLQTLCETFECWLDFKIEHESSGKIKTKFVYEIKTEDGYRYEETDTFKTPSDNYICVGKRQQKTITFKEFVGQDNAVGFKYGINLKGIKRTIDSEGIVSKIVVKDNSNEYAPGGFCSISRAKANPSSENFLYNFTYYINQGLLTLTQVTNDLYSSGFNGYLGYYTKLATLNSDRDTLIQEQTEIGTAIMEAQSNLTVYTASVTAAEEQLVNEQTKLKQTTQPYEYKHFMALTTDQTVDLDSALAAGAEDWDSWEGLSDTQLDNLFKINESLWELFSGYNKATKKDIKEIYESVHGYKVWKESETVIKACNKIINLDKRAASHRTLYKQAESALLILKERETEIKEILMARLIEKERLNKTFYHKYSRFIQEGSWISEDYIDDELYYLDAESTLYTSSQPMISYNIEVLELSQVEGYEGYNFGLGDKTYVEDTEFFGWVFRDGDKTPYKEEVVVSEITINLDSPEKNRLKVQNYKTQFEDLFQRVTAMTQAIEYSTGQYDKAAGIISPTGALTFSTLQNSMANNAIVLQNAKDQSVIWDESGITTTCLTKPSEIVRIVSGGIFLSKDGGTTWQTGITGSGINASYITTGQLDTNVIRIMNGIHASFRWDNTGLTAYKFKPEYDANGQIIGGSDFKAGIFTRFDQYGIYGIEGQEDFDASKPDANKKSGVDKIWEVAKFALTWKGFSLRSDGTKGYVRISSTDDFQVLTTKGSNLIERIKIGDLSNGSGTRYGMRIKDNDNRTVLETDDFGTLFLKGYMRVGPDATSGTRDRVKFGAVKEYVLYEGILAPTDNPENHDNTLTKLLSVKDSGIDVKADSMGLEEGEVLSIFDDGTILAKRVIIDGGRIGNMTIEEIEKMKLRVLIKITKGDSAIFRESEQNDSKELTAFLTNGVEEFSEIPGKSLTYQWSIDGGEILSEAESFVVTPDKIKSKTGAAVVRCIITVKDGSTGQSLEIK